MQCLQMWLTIGLCAISVNNLLASPVDTLLNADDKSRVVDLSTAGSNQQDGAEVSERDNEVGYLKKSNEKGGDGYQHFESYHDKDGDAYGYEKHEAFGKSDKAKLLNGEKDKDEGSHYTYVQELGDKPKYQKYHSSSDDPGKNKHTNYHYSYNSEDDDEEKPQHSSNYKEAATKNDSSEEDNDEEESGGNDEGDEENDEKDEEKSTNFSFKVFTDDYTEDDANENGDVNSKGNDNGYNFGHGKKNTDVDYSKKSDYTAKNVDDESEDDEEEEEDEDDEEEAADEKESTDKVNTETNGDQGKDKNNYSSYVTFTSLEGDEADGENDEIPKNVVLHQNPQPIKSEIIQTAIKEDDDDEEVENESVEAEDDEVKPTPAKPIVIVHVQPTKPIVLVQEHRAGYTVEHNVGGDEKSGDGGDGKSDGGGDEKSDDGGKGHAGSVSKHLYEIYVTHDTGKSKAGGDSGKAGGDDGDAGGAEDGADEGKSEKLTIPNKKSAEQQNNGGYEVNINYGQKQNSPKKSGNKSTGKKKSILKKKKQQIIKPHTYEVEEYIEDNGGKKVQLNAGKESAPIHHRDNGDYSYGQQFIYASEADSDAYYW